jgi:hypothetical protein
MGLLKSELAARHLVVTHLLDSLPASFGADMQRHRCRMTCRKADRSLNAIEATCPNCADIITTADHERNLSRILDDLLERIEAQESVSSAAAVSACVRELRESSRKILDAVSTYNASVITYRNYLERPISSTVARMGPGGDFEVFDLTVHGSTDSRRPGGS